MKSKLRFDQKYDFLQPIYIRTHLFYSLNCFTYYTRLCKGAILHKHQAFTESAVIHFLQFTAHMLLCRRINGVSEENGCHAVNYLLNIFSSKDCKRIGAQVRVQDFFLPGAVKFSYAPGKFLTVYFHILPGAGKEFTWAIRKND